MSALRLVFVACLSCAAVATGVSVGGGGSSPSRASGAAFDFAGSATQLSGSGLVVPAADMLLGPAQEAAQRAAERANPVADREREASRTRFAGLGVAQSARLVRQAFPAIVRHREGSIPLTAGERIVGYSGRHTAQILLPAGRHGFVDSLQPIARRVAPGRYAPIDLALRETGNGFVPVAGSLPIDISRHLQDGVSLPTDGVSLTPLDARGRPVDALGQIDGSTVFYGDIGNDTDALVKPAPRGFEEDTVLRSASSPTQLDFKVGLPSGATLRPTPDGGVLVQDAGRTVAEIPAPTAHDAEGASVPISSSYSKGVMKLSVDVGRQAQDGGYRYPVLVDPFVTDANDAYEGESENSNWASSTNDPAAITISDHGMIQQVQGVTYPGGAYGYDVYPTQGASHIFAFTAEGVIYDTYGPTRGTISISSPKQGLEGEAGLTAWAFASTATACAEGSCAAKPVTVNNETNRAYFEISTLEESHEYFDASFFPLVYVDQEKGPTGSVDTAAAEINGKPNAAHSGTWITTKGNTPAALGVEAYDPGTGVNAVGLKSPSSGTWGYGRQEQSQMGCAGPEVGVQCNECDMGECAGGQHGSQLVLPFAYLGELPDGEDVVEATVQDAVGLAATASAKVKVDNTPPSNITLTGLPSEMAAGEYHLKAEATDGAGTTPSSGVSSIALFVDGKELGSPAGSCKVEKGPCTASAEWAIAARNYAAGTHYATVVASDGAGNFATTEATFKVNAVGEVAVGPGSVDLASGEFSLNATDVSLGGGLTVGRTYGSRHLDAGGLNGLPLGSSWELTLGEHQTLKMQPNESMVLASGGGAEVIFAKQASGYESPAGNKNLTLTSQEKEGTREFVLKNEAAGTSTTFERPTKTGEVWVPVIQQGAVATDTVTYSYESNYWGAKPLEMLAPVPAGVSCSPELKPGCRALTFVYSGAAGPGEEESEWGEATLHLKEILYWAYNPTTKEMQKTPVAQYQYDGKGRLRTEWDPRISPALKTTYGYDSEGHVTAFTPPGEETWAFTYGTLTDDSSAGRLLKAMQAPAATALWSGAKPANVEKPKITGSPYVGVRLAVSTGKWSGAPVSYSYQWDDCNSVGLECKAVPGADNPNYRLTSSDVGHTVSAQVTATNGWGSVVAEATAINETRALASEFALPAGSKPFGIAAGPESELWFTNSGTGKIGKMTTGGSLVAEYATENDQPEGITGVGGMAAVWFVEHTFRNVGKMTTTGVKSIHTLTRTGTYNVGIAYGTDQNLWFTESESNYIGKISTGLEVLGEYALPAGSKPTGITSGPDGNRWFTDEGSSKIGKITSAGVITEYGLPAGSKPTGITSGPDGNLWFTDAGTSKVGKITTAGAVTEYALPAGSKPDGIVTGSDKNLWFTDSGTSKVGRITTSGMVTEYALPAGSQPYGIASGADGNIWFTDYGTSKISRFPINVIEGEYRAPEPGSTVEYNVALSGAGLPSMTSGEVAKWGQTDTPVEATAVLAPDKPQEWPASSYSGSTIFYTDAQGHIVNVKNRAGGISTTEYNATNDVVRTLSSDNREAALKEGSKSAEVAKLLDTQSSYSSDGTELQSTLGPRHLVKLSSGKESQARNHAVYSYDEGAPAEGGPYHLVTKETTGAQVEGEAEQDVLTTTRSYAGQGNLGWRQRQPTSVTTDPSGLNLTQVTSYDETTGAVTESKMPAGAKGEVSSPLYVWQTGTAGSGNGQLKSPHDDVLDAKGDILVADEQNDRIVVFNEKGEFMKNIGSLGSGNGQLNEPRGVTVDSKGNIWVADTSNNRIEEFNENGEFLRVVGSHGSGPGQFSAPKAIATDPYNNVWVSDSANNRLEEFNEKGEYLKTVGSTGSGNGQFKEPRGLAVAPNGSIWVTDQFNNRVEVFKENGEYEKSFGTSGSGNGQFHEPKALTVARGTVWVSDSMNNRVEGFNEKGEYLSQFGTAGTGNGQFKETQGIAVDARGNAFVVDSLNSRVEKWEVPIHGGAHDTQSIYYSAASNPTYPACGNRPEWADLVCRIQPAGQPEIAGLPSLAVTTYTYNVWGEPETVTSTSGSSTQTTTTTYDAADRPLTSSTSSTTGAPLPTRNFKYDEKLGDLSEESTTVEGKAQSLKSTFNTLGELATYTDANGTVSTYEYEKEGDARLKSVNDGKGTQTYGYDETSGEITSLTDTSSEAFAMTATYDAEGNMLTEGYPNGMTASFAYNQVGEQVGIEYEKKTHCSEKCLWYKDTVVPTIHGKWASQSSTQASNRYTYDAAGRLTQVQNEPVGKGCTTRLYAYDEDSNRTSVTTLAPGAGGECTTSSGTQESRGYDQADRLIDGASYDAFGDITKLPAADAGGWTLESGFYVDSRLASQTQNGETIAYNLDPSRRIAETIASGKTAGTTINHYRGPGLAPSWTSEPSGSSSRAIIGIEGRLVATQHNTEAPVLELDNLHGDIVATATMSETASALASTIGEANEWGVPASEGPPKYSWLGAEELPGQLASGVVAMGARSYVPQLGRFLQTDPIPGGSANAYAYTYDDPVNASDLSGEYTATIDQFDEEYVGGRSQQAAEVRAAENAAARAEAEREWAEIDAEDQAEEAAAAASRSHPPAAARAAHHDSRGSAKRSMAVIAEAKCNGTNHTCHGEQASHSGPAPTKRPHAEAKPCFNAGEWIHTCGKPAEHHIFEGNTPEEKVARGAEEVGKYVIQKAVENAGKDPDA